MYNRLDKKPQDFVEPTTTTTAPAARIENGGEPAPDDGGGELDGLDDFDAPPED